MCDFSHKFWKLTNRLVQWHQKWPYLAEVTCPWPHWHPSRLGLRAQRLTDSVMIAEVWPSSWLLRCGWDWTRCSPWIHSMAPQHLCLYHFYLWHRESSFFRKSLFDHWNTQRIFKWKHVLRETKKDRSDVVDSNEWHSLGRTAFILSLYFLAKARGRWKLWVIFTLPCQVCIFWILTEEKSLSNFFAPCSQSWPFTINIMPSKSGNRRLVTILLCN